MTRRKLQLAIDALEARETPAVFVNATTLTYQDVDGDNVTVRFSKPILTAGNAPTIFTFNNAFGTLTGQQLQTINLTSVAAAAGGTTITTTALRSPVNGGDGFAAIGQIDATGIDLSAVNIDGDLGRIRAGDATTTTAGLASLTTASLGRFGTNTGATDLVTFIQGKLGALTVKGDMKEAFVDVEGGADGDIGTVNILGSLIGGPIDEMGRIEATGDIGLVTIKGSIIGGDGDDSGIESVFGKLAGVTIGGDVIGGNGSNTSEIRASQAIGAIKVKGNVIGGSGSGSARIFAVTTLASVTIGGNLEGGIGNDSALIDAFDSIGPVRITGDVMGGLGFTSGGVSTDKLASVFIGGNLIGGDNSNSGRITAFEGIGTAQVIGDITGGNGSSSGKISSNNTITRVTIGGDVVGGSGNESGSITAGGTAGGITTLSIKGNLIGGSATGTTNLSRSGYIRTARIGTLTIGGSLIAGTDNTSGVFDNNGAIRVGNDIGTATIGNIIGNATNPAIISARGKANLTATATSDVAIGSLRVLGRVEYAQIIAGVDLNGVAKNADAQIGAVTVGGDWIASSLVAGAIPGNGLFGDTGDAKMAGVGIKDTATISSKITSLTIGGQAYGTFGGTDHFGIVAENIGTVRVGGTLIPTTAGNGNDDIALGITNDFRVNEV